MSSTANTIIRVCCADCEGDGVTENYVAAHYHQREEIEVCPWCDGEGYIEYKELYDTLADAWLDYPDATEIFPVE
jgi:DnaJ-class molecular chaperone